jgi:hypothetical protein
MTNLLESITKVVTVRKSFVLLKQSFPPQRPGFAPGSSQVGFSVDKMAIGQIFSEYYGFLCQSSFHQILHHSHTGQVQYARSGRRAEWTQFGLPPPTLRIKKNCLFPTGERSEIYHHRKMNVCSYDCLDEREKASVNEL